MLSKKEVKELRKLCEPLKKAVPQIQAIWLYGSAVRKKEFKKTSDIDILVLVDDTRKDFNKKVLTHIALLIKIVELEASKKGLKLHFQPPRRLTTWWELVKSHEPWVITSMKDSVILFDDSGYISQVKRLLKKKARKRYDETVEELLERANSNLREARQILLYKIPHEMLFAMTETAQRLLQLHGAVAVTPLDACKDLKALSRKGLLEKNLVDDFEEVLLVNEKISKGTLTEFSGKDLERYEAKMNAFVEEVEKLFRKTLEEKKREKLLQAYKDAVRLGRAALSRVAKKKPRSDEELLNLFEKELVSKGFIDEVHLKTLKELCRFKSKEKSRIKKERYLQDTYIKSFEIAVKDLLHYLKEEKHELKA